MAGGQVAVTVPLGRLFNAVFPVTGTFSGEERPRQQVWGAVPWKGVR